MNLDPLFPLGQIVATPNALSKLTSVDIHTALQRHAKGDWGKLSKHDHLANNVALAEGTRLLSSYTARSGY